MSRCPAYKSHIHLPTLKFHYAHLTISTIPYATSSPSTGNFMLLPYPMLLSPPQHCSYYPQTLQYIPPPKVLPLSSFILSLPTLHLSLMPGLDHIAVVFPLQHDVLPEGPSIPFWKTLAFEKTGIL